MTHHHPPFRLLLLLGTALLAGEARAQHMLPNAPVVNFKLPSFTRDGYRTWLAKGAEARYISEDRIDLTNLTFTTFSGDAQNRVGMVFLAPSASLLPARNILQGDATLRVVHDDFEITGVRWIYHHAEKSVSIRQDVRVIFHEELQSIIR
jgi:hypothetical protein